MQVVKFRPDSLQDAKDKIAKQVMEFLSLANTERKILKVFYEARGFSKEIDYKWVEIRNKFTERIEDDIKYVQSSHLAKKNVNKNIVAKGWFFINEMFLWDLVTNDKYSHTLDEIVNSLVELYTTGLYVE